MLAYDGLDSTEALLYFLMLFRSVDHLFNITFYLQYTLRRYSSVCNETIIPLDGNFESLIKFGSQIALVLHDQW